MESSAETSWFRPRLTASLLAITLLLGAALYLATHVSAPPPDSYARQFMGRWRTRDVAIALALAWSAVAILLAGCSRRAIVRFLVANASVAVVWCGLELLGFAGVISYPRLLGMGEGERLGMARIPHLDVHGRGYEDLAESWGLSRPPVDFHFVTDRFGFRNEPDSESAEVYCLGDSFLVDGLVPHPDLVSAQLEKRLGLSVMSLALLGISPQAEEQLLKDVAPPLEGRLVLHFIFEGNDLLDSAEWRAGPQVAKSSRKERTLLNQIVLRLQAWTDPHPPFVRNRCGWIGAQDYYFLWLRNSFEGLDGEIAPILDCLARLRLEIEAAGGRYMVVSIPSKIRVLGPFCRFDPDSPIADWQAQCGPLPGALRDWAAREGVALLDLTEPLRESARTGSVPWFQADTHWNAVGQRVAAQALAEFPPVRDWARVRGRR